MTHTSRIEAAGVLAREVADLLLAGGLCPELMPDNWGRAVALGRAWFRDYCPRYPRDEVETQLVWVGTAMLTLAQLRERTALPEGHRDRLTAGQVPGLFRETVAAHWRSAADTYVRHCDRVDSHPAAERRVAEIAGRVARRSAEGVRNPGPAVLDPLTPVPA